MGPGNRASQQRPAFRGEFQLGLAGLLGIPDEFLGFRRNLLAGQVPASVVQQEHADARGLLHLLKVAPQLGWTGVLECGNGVFPDHSDHLAAHGTGLPVGNIRSPAETPEHEDSQACHMSQPEGKEYLDEQASHDRSIQEARVYQSDCYAPAGSASDSLGTV